GGGGGLGRGRRSRQRLALLLHGFGFGGRRCGGRLDQSFAAPGTVAARLHDGDLIAAGFRTCRRLRVSPANLARLRLAPQATLGRIFLGPDGRGGGPGDRAGAAEVLFVRAGLAERFVAHPSPARLGRRPRLSGSGCSAGYNRSPATSPCAARRTNARRRRTLLNLRLRAGAAQCDLRPWLAGGATGRRRRLGKLLRDRRLGPLVDLGHLRPELPPVLRRPDGYLLLLPPAGQVRPQGFGLPAGDVPRQDQPLAPR